VITILGRFSNAYNVQSFLVPAGNGRFYSSAQLSSNPGAVFCVTATPGGIQVDATQDYVPSFTANIPDGNMLALGYGNADLPYLLEADTSGVVTPLHAFPNGTHLTHTAFYASDGNIYGISYLPDGSGSVYKVTPDGAFTKFLTFPTDAFSYPILDYAPLLQSVDGNLYGVTTTGGTNGKGTTGSNG
jgi:hypothetical protein